MNRINFKPLQEADGGYSINEKQLRRILSDFRATEDAIRRLNQALLPGLPPLGHPSESQLAQASFAFNKNVLRYPNRPGSGLPAAIELKTGTNVNGGFTSVFKDFDRILNEIKITQAGIGNISNRVNLIEGSATAASRQAAATAQEPPENGNLYLAGLVAIGALIWFFWK
jgi:hypothetical protein